jgi:hypothetical protein
MGKTRRNKRKSYKLNKKTNNLFKKVKGTTDLAVPVLKKGLKTVGSSVKTVAIKSAPTINKGLAGIYGTLATGFNMGLKGVSKMTKRNRSKRKK